MVGSQGGKISGIKQRAKAIQDYYASPNSCKNCNQVICVPDGTKVSAVRKKVFCSHTCSATVSNKNRSKRQKQPKETVRSCRACGIEFACKGNAHFCGLVCRKEAWVSHFWTSDAAKKMRRNQLDGEESVAASLRLEGWEVFSPTVVCDRIGIKDGKVFFLEFKPKGRESLRPGQKRIQECVPEMYEVVVHDSF
jgi:hypothetical protein